MPAPSVDTDYFETFSGLVLTDGQLERVEILIDRARRALLRELGSDFDFGALSADDNLDWKDAVAELAWFYFEAERANAMEILSLPVSQLSLGTLFWTKESGYGGPRALGAVNSVIRWKGNSARIVLYGDLEYPRAIP